MIAAHSAKSAMSLARYLTVDCQFGHSLKPSVQGWPSVGSDVRPAAEPALSVDRAGLGAMTPFIRSKLSNRNNMLPLPTGTTEDLRELFGFWTDDLRMGQYPDANTQQSVWSSVHSCKPKRNSRVRTDFRELTGR